MNKKNYINNIIVNNQFAILFFMVFIVYFCLSFFKYPYADESYYLLETSNIADIISKGSWIGNDAVGIHGFLFKIPVALIFIITGPSAFIAALSNVILAVFAAFIFSQILKKYFSENYLIITGLILLVTNSLFVRYPSTFLREIPALFSFLLFLYFVIYKKNKFLIGLSLLLILDSKEHVFFQLMPGFIIWLVYSIFINSKNKKIIIKAKELIICCFFYFFPAILYLFLMFFSTIIPINMFAAYILGLIDKGLAPVVDSFTSMGTHGGLEIDQFDSTIFSTIFVKYFHFKKILLFKNYCIKFFLPAIASILTIPKIILVPSFIISWLSLFKKNNEFKEDSKLFFLLMWSYFFIFYFRASHGRYFFAILPIIILYFIQFIKNFKFNRTNIIILSVTYITIIAGFLFEYKSLISKIFINHLFILIMLLLAYNNHFNTLQKKKIYILLGCIYGFFTFSIITAASFISETGQIRNSLIYGYCGEFKKISNMIDSSLRTWINHDPRLIKFYLSERISNVEWHWNLKSVIPKKAWLKSYNNKTVFFQFEDIEHFRKELFINSIEQLCFLVSTDERKKYYKEEILESLLKQNFLKLVRVNELKNKKVYIFQLKK